MRPHPLPRVPGTGNKKAIHRPLWERISCTLWTCPTLVTCALLLPSPALAGPYGEQVTAGQATVSREGNTTTIDQGSQKVSINWQLFSSTPSEVIRFNQPDPSAVALNRVVGNDPSALYGRLEANGQVFLVNPNGVLFGPTSQISVHGLLATTLDISDDNFLAGEYRFERSALVTTEGRVSNQGSITADSGYVVLAGDTVENSGLIEARLGEVALASGSRLSLDLAGDGLISLAVDEATLASRAGVTNLGQIKADGGRVLMTAQMQGELLGTVVNNQGLIQARTIQEQEGEIVLLGGMESGTVEVDGTLDASAPESGDGGHIETSGHTVKVRDRATITTHAPLGKTGTWLIDPTDYTVSPTGGDISGTALANSLAFNNVTIQSIAGLTEGNGDIYINDDIRWTGNNSLTLDAINSIKVNAAIDNFSGTGTVILRADADSLGDGTVLFGDGGSLRTGGIASIFYNPLDYTTPTDYTAFYTAGELGSLTAYMLVNTVEDLQGININLRGTYALGREIDAAATVDWNNGEGFAPLGDTAGFTGLLEGGGHAVRGLFINRPLTSQVGLFSSLAPGGEVRNLDLVGARITGDNFVGAISGDNGGRITNVSSSGSINGNNNVGGLAGINTTSGRIVNSNSASDIRATSEVGGLVGANLGIIGNSYSRDNVVARDMVGGVAGKNAGSLFNVYSTGRVAGTTDVGGLVGLNASGSAVFTSFSSAQVVAPPGATTVGGLIGRAETGSGTVSNSFWDLNTSGQATSAGGTGKTKTELMSAQTYSNWDFTNTWWLSEGNTRPFLRSEYSTTITNGHQLQLMAMDLAADYTVVRNIIMAELRDRSGMWDTAKGFLPVSDAANQYAGVFDGKGHTVKDLFINRPDTQYVGGLFGGCNDGSSLRHIGLLDVDITGGFQTGGLAAHMGIGATVLGSYTTGVVRGTANTVGGLVGLNAGTISHSFSRADVSGQVYVGGLTGANWGEVAYVKHSYSTGQVSGTTSVGGLVGTNFNTGPDPVVDSYWDTETSGQSISAGGTGKTTAEMQQEATYPSWDFANTWRIYEGATYPLLKRFLTPITFTVTANDTARVYGDPNPDFSATYGGAVDMTRIQGVLSLTTSAGQASPVGAYAIVPGGLSSLDYDIIFFDGTLLVTPRSLFLTGLEAAHKVFDGTTTATINSYGTLTNIIGRDEVILNTQEALANFDSIEVGADKIVTVTNLGLDGRSAGNYAIGPQRTVADILPAEPRPEPTPPPPAATPPQPRTTEEGMRQEAAVATVTSVLTVTPDLLDRGVDTPLEAGPLVTDQQPVDSEDSESVPEAAVTLEEAAQQNVLARRPLFTLDNGAVAGQNMVCQ